MALPAGPHRVRLHQFHLHSKAKAWARWRSFLKDLQSHARLKLCEISPESTFPGRLNCSRDSWGYSPVPAGKRADFGLWTHVCCSGPTAGDSCRPGKGTLHALGPRVTVMAHRAGSCPGGPGCDPRTGCHCWGAGGTAGSPCGVGAAVPVGGVGSTGGPWLRGNSVHRDGSRGAACEDTGIRGVRAVAPPTPGREWFVLTALPHPPPDGWSVPPGRAR